MTIFLGARIGEPNGLYSFSRDSNASGETVRSPSERSVLTPVREVQLANASSNWSKLGEVLKPDGIAYGESHGDTPLGSFGRGGNFGVISLKDGRHTYFGSQFLKPAPPIPTPFGLVRGGISLTGTNGARGNGAGVGVSYKFPTPAGDLLFILNCTQDAATVGNLMDALQGNAKKELTVRVTFGAAYSVSDGAVRLLAGPTAGASMAVGAGLEGAGVDAWLGLAWTGTATIKDGQLKSINISGVEIPAAQIGQVFGGQLQQARNSPPMMPNGGDPRIASLNDDVQLAFGQSPWDVGFSAQKRDGKGAIEVRGGTVNVLNHGNRATAIAEPVYELGVKYKVLGIGERIRNNQHAGEVVEKVLARALAQDKSNEAKGQKTTLYLQALNAFMNPYQLNHGSSQLKNAHEFYERSPGNQLITNASRAVQGLPPLPSSALGESKPADYSRMRDIFSGQYRWKPDLGTTTPLPNPRGGFRLGV
ncbi:MAG: hypothetical protein HEQ39_12340 [Rhizobacter sp.]